MQFKIWVFALASLVSMSAHAEDVDVDKIALSERKVLARCLTDTLEFVKKYHLGNWLDGFLDASCAPEIESVVSAARNQLKEPLNKQVVPNMLAYGMFENARKIYDEEKLTSCSGNSCLLNEYRACAMRQMSSAIKLKRSPSDFEMSAEKACANDESNARIALTNDLTDILKQHALRGVNHPVYELLGKVVKGLREEVVVLYGEDLVKIQPDRRSCKPQMCGALPCISLEKTPTEYECVIDQK